MGQERVLDPTTGSTMVYLPPLLPRPWRPWRASPRAPAFRKGRALLASPPVESSRCACRNATPAEGNGATSGTPLPVVVRRGPSWKTRRSSYGSQWLPDGTVSSKHGWFLIVTCAVLLTEANPLSEAFLQFNIARQNLSSI